MVARHDLTTDTKLQQQLLTARRGTAFFSRKLSQLTDAELDGPTRLPGWTRRHLVAHVGYNARALARLINWAATGVENPMYESMQVRNEEIAYGATLSAIALRNLHEHAAVHLNVEWRDLPEDRWSHPVRTAQGRTVPVAETVWMRTREVWMHAVDLGNGAWFQDIPHDVLKRLLGDITQTWMTRGEGQGLLLRAGSTQEAEDFGDFEAPNPTLVTGTLPALAAWASGRSGNGVTSTAAEVPAAPRWI